MAGYKLSLQTEENLILSAQAAQRLIATGDGDAALLYLALLSHREDAADDVLRRELRWEADRLCRAEGTLLSLGLLGDRRTPVPQEEPERERPDYTRDDVSATLERDIRFAGLTAEVERKLGKRLNSSDLQILLGLYDFLGLPADVIFLLVGHCIDQSARSYGTGRRPTLRQIEKEGYHWARQGLLDMERAGEYLRKYSSKQGRIPEVMAALRLGERRPSPSEEKYMLSWLEWGFPIPVIELAYDKTILKCRELKWGYLNAILRRWHENGLHTMQEVKSGDAAPPAATGGEDLSWMKEYI